MVLPPIEIQPDMIAALVGLGRLHPSEKEAVTSAIGALVLRALQGGVSPSEKPLLAVDLDALQAAWIWGKPGSQPSPKNAAKALANVTRCSALVGFGPEEFGERLKAMAGIN